MTRPPKIFNSVKSLQRKGKVLPCFCSQLTIFEFGLCSLINGYHLEYQNPNLGKRVKEEGAVLGTVSDT
uniref:Uncharacterized protein n=1 Tax=Solanum lycopersicum TaxID=4081 RepID=A0A3Q7G9L2_SOLLC